MMIAKVLGLRMLNKIIILYIYTFSYIDVISHMRAHKIKNENKSKEQLEKELTELRRRISELETCEIKHARTQESLRESERMLSTLIGNLPGMAYSTQKPFDFSAGGKGPDLLRMKIFSERYNFKIDMDSSRCGYIPQENDICPGKISECTSYKKQGDCYCSGGTAFSICFPPAPIGEQD
jgi:hypothetical protein